MRTWQWARGTSFWLDEQLVALNIRGDDFAGLIGPQPNATAAPLGWLWLERLVMTLLGEGERAMKLPSVTFGVGVLVVAWWFGRQWLNWAGRLCLVGLFALNPSMTTYSDQLKHYALDVFVVLLLITLALRLTEAPRSRHRMVAFWITAAIGLWLCMGAFLALAAIALAVAVATWRRQGPRALVPHVIGGLVCLVSFAGHYFLSLRFATGSEYLNQGWSFGYPPPGVKVRGFLYWLEQRIESVSENPLFIGDLHSSGGPHVVAVVSVLLFWIAVIAGTAIAVRRRPALGMMIVGLIASALVYSVAHLVPLAVRLALWAVPALFLAVAVAVDRVYTVAATRWQPASAGLGRAGSAATAVAVIVAVIGPMATSWAKELGKEPALDDRAAIAWMIEQHQPDDVVLFSAASFDAMRWYDPAGQLGGARWIGSVDDAGCDPQVFAESLHGRRRVLAYSGVRYVPYLNTYDVLRKRLSEVGTIEETKHFGALGIVYVVRLSDAPTRAAPGDCIVV